MTILAMSYPVRSLIIFLMFENQTLCFSSSEVGGKELNNWFGDSTNWVTVIASGLCLVKRVPVLGLRPQLAQGCGLLNCL